MMFNTESFLLKAIKTGIYLALITPLVLAPIFGPVGLAKTIFFRIIVEVIFALWIFLILLNRQYLPKRNILFWAVLVFFGISTLAVAFSANPYRSFWGTLDRNEGLITHLHLLGFFVVLTSVFKKRESWLKLLKFCVGISFLVSILALVQKLTHLSFYGATDAAISRVTSTMGNPDFLAPYLVLNIFLGLFLVLICRRNLWRGIWTGIALFNFCILIFTGSRGGWLGVAAGLFIISFVLFRPAIKILASRKIFIILLLLIFAFSLFVLFNQDRFKFLGENIIISKLVQTISSPTTKIRPASWNIAIEGWKERPSLGWGQEMYGYTYDKYLKAAYFKYYDFERLNFDRAHSMVFDTLVTTGILGLLSYLAIFIIALYILLNWKSEFSRWGVIILFSLLAAHFVQNLFIFETITSYLVFFLILGFISNNFSKK